MKRNEQAWRSFLLTLDDDVFFNVIRNYLGPVQTPYNKHQLLERLIQYLQREEIRKSIIARVSGEDLELLSAIDLLETSEPQAIIAFFDGRGTPAELYAGLLNLMDRLLIYRDETSDIIRINPLLLEDLRNIGMGADLLFPSEEVDAVRMSLPWFNDMSAMGAISILLDEEGLARSDGKLRKAVVRRFAKLMPAFRETGELLLMHFLGSLSRLALIREDESGVRLSLDTWREWAKLSMADRHYLYWAAYIASTLETTAGTGAPGKTGDGNPSAFLDFQERSAEALSLRRFLASLNPRRGYKRETLARMLLLQAPGRSLRVPPGRSLDVMVELGLLEMRDFDYMVNPAVFALSPDPGVEGETAQQHSGPAIVLHGDYRITVHPHGDFSRAVSLAFCSRLTDFDLISTYELSREALFRALSLGVEGSDILDSIDALSNHHIPQNIRFSLESWIGEFHSVRLNAGYLLRVDGKSLPLVRDVVKNRHDVIELGEGAFLFPRRNLDWIDVLEERGLHVATLLQLENSRDDGTMPSFIPLPPESRRGSGAKSPAPGGTGAGSENARKSAPDSSEIQKELLDHARSLTLNEDVEKELMLRIENGLILRKDQINAGIIRPDITEARGLNYTAKLRLIEMALSNRDMLEFHQSGSETPFLLRPVKVHKKPGKASDLLEARSIPGDEELVIHIAKARLIRRLKGSLFNRI
jgi:hypothetical protein